MKRPLIRVAIGAALLVVAGMAQAAEPFPTKTIRIIVPAAPGGALDLTTRLVAQKMSEDLKQPIIVDNRAGADNIIGTRMVRDAVPDGYTLLAQANGLLVIPELKLEAGFDPIKDFTPIGLMVTQPMLMDVGSDSPYKTVTDFVAAAKAQPGQLTYGSSGVGGPPHFAAAAFLHAAGIEATHVPYKGNGPALADVAGGRLSFIFDGFISTKPYLSGNKVLVLAVSGDTRLKELPDVPTFRELGLDYSYSLWLGLLAPAGTPKDVIQRLSDSLHRATAQRDLQQHFEQDGATRGQETPDEYAQFLAADQKSSLELIKELKLSKQ